jgi:hypothetical protein
MEFATIPARDLRQTRVAQEWIEEGRQEGRQEGETKVAIRQLARRCGPLSNATTARIQAQLDFSGPADLAAWLAEHDSLRTGAGGFAGCGESAGST